MAFTVFLTGVTGYIGGNAFDYIYQEHKGKGYRWLLLVRDEECGKKVKEVYPDVEFVYGTIQDSEVLEKAAAEADVVIDTADSADCVAAATAIAKGLKAGHGPERSAWWIHLSGTGILTYGDVKKGREGEAPLPEDEYFDVDGIDRLVNLPLDAWHKDVDQIAQDANSDSVFVAIICPCTIYDVGRGPVKRHSQQVPDMIRATLNEGYVPVIGNGLTEWDNVNVHDLGDLYLRLFNAIQNPELSKNPEVFGINGYFFARNGEHKWSDVAKQISEVTKRPIKSITMADNAKLKNGNITWGSNSKGVPQRAKKYLGWEAKGCPLSDTIAEACKVEADRLGLTL
ncbi:Uncharacterized protein ESCO_000324 [Escovopsis weberi]|uniref:NAD-dependent epimerase/dehydratase domain-containing protein n=1 Tax=Escovopsis weberi TaxID=150374 RepID=A0A0M9VUE8_ESCWE|nr:Uncharacterized protein ESCO_000324 [Escovopsis weberi]